MCRCASAYLMDPAVWLGFWNSHHVVSKSSIRSSASPRTVAVWLGLWNSDHVVLKSRIPSLASPHSIAVWLSLWNSGHVVLKLSIRTSASPRQQQSDKGLRVTQNAYLLLITHTKQLLLVTFCDNTAGIWVIFRTHGRTETRTEEGQTDVEVEIVI